MVFVNGDVPVVNAGSTSLKLSVFDLGERSRPVPSLEEAPSVTAVYPSGRARSDRFHQPTLINDDVFTELLRLTELGPLHNWPAIDAIKATGAALPNVRHVAVFDTAFHRTLPDVAKDPRRQGPPDQPSLPGSRVRVITAREDTIVAGAVRILGRPDRLQRLTTSRRLDMSTALHAVPRCTGPRTIASRRGWVRPQRGTRASAWALINRSKNGWLLPLAMRSRAVAC